MRTKLSNKHKTLLLIAILMCFFSCNFNQSVEVGQIYVGIDSSNPFRNISYDTVIVIDIKKDYAKVIKNGDTTSMRLDNVNWNRSLLKNNNK